MVPDDSPYQYFLFPSLHPLISCLHWIPFFMVKNRGASRQFEVHLRRQRRGDLPHFPLSSASVLVFCLFPPDPNRIPTPRNDQSTCSTETPGSIGARRVLRASDWSSGRLGCDPVNQLQEPVRQKEKSERRPENPSFHGQVSRSRHFQPKLKV